MVKPFVKNRVKISVAGSCAIFFIYILYKAQRISESLFSQLFIAVLPFSFVGNATNFFIHSLNWFILKKAAYVAGFFQSGALFVACICKYSF